MSNKKQSSIDWLALYIKGISSLNSDEIIEQAKSMHKEEIEDAIAFGNISRPNITNDDWIKRQTPIELPTDEEIYINSNVNSENTEQHIGFIKGIQLMRELIKNNK